MQTMGGDNGELRR